MRKVFPEVPCSDCGTKIDDEDESQGSTVQLCERCANARELAAIDARLEEALRHNVGTESESYD